MNTNKTRQTYRCRSDYNSLIIVFIIFVIHLNFSCNKSIHENLIEAARNGEISKIKTILDNGANVNYQDASGKTVLHLLCLLPFVEDNSQSSDSIFLYLIDHGSDVNIADKNGNTPLFYSIQSGNYDVTVFLVNHGANVNQRNKNLQTPMYNAVSFIISGVKEVRSIEFVRFLYQAGADILVKDKEGKNLMHNSKDPMITAWLIEHGLSPRLKDIYGKTPLDYSSAEIFKMRDAIAGADSGPASLKNSAKN